MKLIDRTGQRYGLFTVNGYNKQLKKTNTGYFFITQNKFSKYSSIKHINYEGGRGFAFEE